MGDDQRQTGERIREFMAARLVTQDRIAERLGISQSQVSRRLSGEIAFRLPELALIAHELNVPMGALIGEPADVAS
jgi:transcriptional regulator with XRE-family HTH domain